MKSRSFDQPVHCLGSFSGWVGGGDHYKCQKIFLDEEGLGKQGLAQKIKSNNKEAHRRQDSMDTLLLLIFDECPRIGLESSCTQNTLECGWAQEALKSAPVWVSFCYHIPLLTPFYSLPFSVLFCDLRGGSPWTAWLDSLPQALAKFGKQGHRHEIGQKENI